MRCVRNIGLWARYVRRAAFHTNPLLVFQMAAPTGKGLYPMFVISEGQSSDLTCNESDQAGQVLKVQHYDKKGRVKQSSKDSDDFVFL